MYRPGELKKTNGTFLRQTANNRASMNLGSNGCFIAENFYTKRFGGIRFRAVATFSL
jgi:hypothetical protein